MGLEANGTFQTYFAKGNLYQEENLARDTISNNFSILLDK